MNLPFHAVAGAGLVLALAFSLFRRSPGAVMVSALAYMLLGAGGALAFARGSFELLSLAAWGIFLYGVLFAAAASVLLARVRARPARVAALATGACALGLAVIALDAFVIEPRALELRRVNVTTAKLTRPLRIAVLADLQAERIGAYERDAIRRVLAERPDLILMAGDYVQGKGPLGRHLRRLLREEKWTAPLGVFAVRGNCEGEGWARMFDGLPITAFESTDTVVRGDLAITCLTLGDSFASGLVVPGRPEFHVVLGHGPDFALGEVAADLLIAGHTHGGQVRLPFIGPLITLSKVPRAWAGGVTRLDGDRTLIVSRGVGMERGDAPRLRFLCRPEIVIVDVAPVRRLTSTL